MSLMAQCRAKARRYENQNDTEFSHRPVPRSLAASLIRHHGSLPKPQLDVKGKIAGGEEPDSRFGSKEFSSCLAEFVR
jgi:hypothetical protein